MNLSKKSKINTGSVTVETAIALPIFMFVILGMTILMRVIFTYGTIQHAINETAETLSTYSYLYSIKVKNQDEKIKKYLGDFIENPQNKFGKIAGMIVNGAYADIKSVAITPLIKEMVSSYLKNENSDEDRNLKALNVVNGINGLDFSESNILEDNKNIEIIVRYKIRVSFLLTEICIIQRTYVRAWMEGEPGSNLGGSSTYFGNVWDLEQMERGREIQTREGKNLPDYFPVIAKYKNGKVTAIKSIDVDAITYKKQENLKVKILGFIQELADFKEGIYMEKEIKINTKELIIVVPEGTIKDEVKMTLEECKIYANNIGINLITKDCYGKKETEKITDEKK